MINTQNPFFKTVLPHSIIRSEYNPNLIETTINTNKKFKNRFCVIVDSIPSYITTKIVDDIPITIENKIHNDRNIQNIIFNGRHYNIFFILTIQYPNIPLALTSNIDYVCVFNEPNLDNRKRIYKDYGGVIPTFEIFSDMLNTLADHECLVIKLNGSSDIKEQVFWYKATI